MTYHTTKISDTRRVRWAIDTDHTSYEGFQCLLTEEESKQLFVEQAKLDSGDLIALGAISETRCACCNEWHEVDSLWGIVTEPDSDNLDTLAPEVSNFPDEAPDVFRIIETLVDVLKNQDGYSPTTEDALDAARSIINAAKGKS